MLTCFDVTNFFLTLIDEQLEEGITNLKLQKLAYYAQGFHLAIFDAKLFDEPIEAWQHGPVVPSLYEKYKHYGRNVIDTPKDVDFSVFTKDMKSFLENVYAEYGQFSAWKLRDLTHGEAPWKDHYKATDIVISLDSMKSFFKTRLVD